MLPTIFISAWSQLQPAATVAIAKAIGQYGIGRRFHMEDEMLGSESGGESARESHFTMQGIVVQQTKKR